ncbi:acyl-CoA dehydrogenase [Streptomyces sp. NPDC001941]|uniref:acyl-CoA dehydrogenase family protein n=1 Tax=Streptomyces sp. NPDC001941 TaxID=3154659 RepID=UPI00332DD0EC
MTLLTFQKEAPSTDGASDIPERSGAASTNLTALPPLVVTTSDQSGQTTGELTQLLFGHDDRARVHGDWRSLLSTEAFQYRANLAPAARTALSYNRLSQVNAFVSDPLALADDPHRLASLHEWTGVVDGALGTLAGIHYNLFLGSIVDHDLGEGRDLSEFTSMRRTGTFLCTELAHGNDAVALRTTAELDRETNEFVLNTPSVGAQKFMPNTSLTGGPKTALVAARLLIDGQDEGVFLFLTPLSDESGLRPGIRVRRLPERTGSPVDHCLTSFDHVRLPREAMLEGDHGRLDAEGVLTSTLGNRRKRFLRSISRVTTGKLCMSAAGTGVTRAALALSVRYAHHRHISGTKADQRVPLSAHRSHHGRLLSATATAYAMTFLHRAVTDRWVDVIRDPSVTKEDLQDAERMVAVAKGWITWQARNITIECRERCGAHGLFGANGLADFPLNLEGAITAEGDNQVIWLKAASEMLFQHTVERSGRPALPLDDESLTDVRFLRELLAEAQSIWQNRARTALRNGPAGDPLARWNAASSSALRMVGAYAPLKAADAFLDAIDRAADPRTRARLTQLCRLFLLEQLADHTGDLLAAGHLTARHVVELPQAVDTVTAELAPHMLDLVEAFDLPEEFLASVPLANSTHLDDFLRMVEDSEGDHLSSAC